MVQIATTIEQSRRLIELGFDISTADMIYCVYSLNDIDEIPILKTNELTVFEDTKIVPAWSLSALIELIPDKISIGNDSYYVYFKKYSAELRGPITWDGRQKTKLFKADNILDAVFEMVNYLLENKLIK